MRNWSPTARRGKAKTTSTHGVSGRSTLVDGDVVRSGSSGPGEDYAEGRQEMVEGWVIVQTKRGGQIRGGRKGRRGSGGEVMSARVGKQTRLWI